jgi:lysozyme
MFKITADFVKKWEGFESSPYLCPADKLTIGYGTIIDPKVKYNNVLGETLLEDSFNLKKQLKTTAKVNIALKNKYPNLLSETQAIDYMILDLKKRWKFISEYLPKGLTDNQCASLLSLSYNIGIIAFKKSTMLRLLQSNNILGASNEFIKWNKATVNGKLIEVKGLTNRRLEEKALFLKV